MTTPRAMICRLCMDTKALSELSRDVSGQVSDICLVCRERELRAVLAQVEAILSLSFPNHPDNEITVEVVRKTLVCGHVDHENCWCGSCHVCHRYLDDCGFGRCHICEGVAHV